MSLNDAIKKGSLSFISQINLNSFKTPSEVLKYSNSVSPYVDAVILNEQIGNEIGMCPIAASHLMKDLGPEPIIHLSGKNQDKEEILSFFRTSWFMGVKNLCISENNIHLFNQKAEKEKEDKKKTTSGEVQDILKTLSSDKGTDNMKFTLFSILDFENTDFEKIIKEVEEEEKKGIQNFITSPIYSKHIITELLDALKGKKIRLFPTIDPSKKVNDLKKLSKINEMLVSRKILCNISKNHSEDKMLKFLGGIIKSLKKSVPGFNLIGTKQQFEKLFKYASLKSKLKKSLGGTTPQNQKFAKIAEAKLTLKEFEKAYIIRVLKITSGNRSEASKILGIHRNTLMRKCSDYKIKI